MMMMMMMKLVILVMLRKQSASAFSSTFNAILMYVLPFSITSFNSLTFFLLL